jgi:hypothetical protein
MLLLAFSYPSHADDEVLYTFQEYENNAAVIAASHCVQTGEGFWQKCDKIQDVFDTLPPKKALPLRLEYYNFTDKRFVVKGLENVETEMAKNENITMICNKEKRSYQEIDSCIEQATLTFAKKNLLRDYITYFVPNNTKPVVDVVDDDTKVSMQTWTGKVIKKPNPIKAYNNECFNHWEYTFRLEKGRNYKLVASFQGSVPHQTFSAEANTFTGVEYSNLTGSLNGFVMRDIPVLKGYTKPNIHIIAYSPNVKYLDLEHDKGGAAKIGEQYNTKTKSFLVVLTSRRIEASSKSAQFYYCHGAPTTYFTPYWQALYLLRDNKWYYIKSQYYDMKPIKDLTLVDINQDGRQDILFGGEVLTTTKFGFERWDFEKYDPCDC